MDILRILYIEDDGVINKVSDEVEKYWKDKETECDYVMKIDHRKKPYITTLHLPNKDVKCEYGDTLVFTEDDIYVERP